jgi:hypothetical protein
MLWKECHVEDERVRFVGRRLDGEKMAALCAEFGIARKTGYPDRERLCLRRCRGITAPRIFFVAASTIHLTVSELIPTLLSKIKPAD